MVILAEQARVIVGVLCMHFGPEAPGIADIDVLAVLPTHRRRYIGSNLVFHLVLDRSASPTGSRAVQEFVWWDRTPADLCGLSFVVAERSTRFWVDNSSGLSRSPEKLRPLLVIAAQLRELLKRALPVSSHRSENKPPQCEGYQQEGDDGDDHVWMVRWH